MDETNNTDGKPDIIGDKNQGKHIEKRRYLDPLSTQPTIDVYCPHCGTLQKTIPTLAGIDAFVVGQINCITCRKTFYIDEDDLAIGVYIIDTHEFVKVL